MKINNKRFKKFNFKTKIKNKLLFCIIIKRNKKTKAYLKKI